MDLSALEPGEPEALMQSFAPRLRSCASIEGACGLLTSEMYERCRSAGGERSLVLNRVFLSLPASALDAGSLDFARRKFGLDPAPPDLFLALMSTHGDAPEWCDRKQSEGHRAIPLNHQTVTTVPMLARCFQQIGFDLDIVLHAHAGIHLEGVASSFGLFHVETALGSEFVPAQKFFVEPYGVRSVVGCGTMLPNGAISIWIGFSRHAITAHSALPLVPMMPQFWRTIQPLYRRRAIFAA